MARLELTEAEAELLCNILGIEQEAWEGELERILSEEGFDSWEALLESTAISGEAITLLKKLGRQLNSNE